MSAGANAYSKNRLNGKDSEGNIKTTLPALFLTDYQNATKFKELFYCDEVWIQKDSENKSIINGLVEENGTNLSMRDVKRKGNLRIRKDNKNYVVLNDAGLNTYAKADKPIPIWIYQGMFKFKLSQLSAFYSITQEYGIYLKNQRTNTEQKFKISEKAPSKAYTTASKYLGGINNFLTGDNILMTSYTINDEGEKKGEQTSFVVDTEAKLMLITKIAKKDDNPINGTSYTLLALNSDYTKENGLNDLYNSTADISMFVNVILTGAEGGVNFNDDITFNPLPAGLYAGISNQLNILTYIDENGRPYKWTKSTYVPVVPTATIHFGMEFLNTDVGQPIISKIKVWLSTDRENGFETSGTLNVTSVTLKENKDYGTSNDIQFLLSEPTTINYVKGDFITSKYIGDVDKAYPENVILGYRYITLSETYIDGMKIVGQVGPAPMPVSPY